MQAPMKTRLAFLAVALLLSAGQPCHAETQREREVARSLAFAEGIEAMEAKDWKTAERIFLGLWAEWQSYDVALTLGQIELKLEKYRDAAEHIAYGLRHIAPREDPAVIDAANKGLARAKTFIGTVRITAEPPDAEVLVDDVTIPAWADGEVFLEPGEHRVRARAGGGAVVEETFWVAAGDLRALYLNTEEARRTAAAAPEPPSGLSPRRKPSWVPAYVLGGVSAASLVSSVVLRASRSNDAQEAERLHGQLSPGACAGADVSSSCGALLGAMDRYDRKGLAADVTLAVGGVAAAAALGYVLYVVLDEPKEAPRLSGSVGFDRTGAGVFVGGSF